VCHFQQQGGDCKTQNVLRVRVVRDGPGDKMLVEEGLDVFEHGCVLYQGWTSRLPACSTLTQSPISKAAMISVPVSIRNANIV